jgi:hypothetical protein
MQGWSVGRVPHPSFLCLGRDFPHPLQTRNKRVRVPLDKGEDIVKGQLS